MQPSVEKPQDPDTPEDVPPLPPTEPPPPPVQDPPAEPTQPPYIVRGGSGVRSDDNDLSAKGTAT
jgi:hypothetical protein